MTPDKLVRKQCSYDSDNIAWNQLDPMVRIQLRLKFGTTAALSLQIIGYIKAAVWDSSMPKQARSNS